MAGSEHTRLPVCEGDLDTVLGIVHVKDVLGEMVAGKREVDLRTLARDPMFVPENATLDSLLREFLTKKSHMALVVDEHGVVSGVVTLENVLEELVGPIQDEHDSETVPIKKVGNDTFEVEAGCPLDKIVKACGLEVDHTDVDTLGGLVVERVGRIPDVGVTVEVGDHWLEVLDADLTKVNRVRISRKVKENVGDIG